ncbi:hypothetical protein BKA65DRAFT_489967 [Rhexocercosporidium sp. MPI-PUGE-AT-0058]|nr:hypothetical protein BKA65DRAFT_489967 [Rhexocercosporidium sp. MPI-PUGE-AT-0058]
MQILESSQALRSPTSQVGDPLPFAASACLFAIVNLASVVRLVGCALLGGRTMKRRPVQVVICCISYLASLAVVDMVDSTSIDNNQYHNAYIIPLLVNGILIALYEGENTWHVSDITSTFLNRLIGGFIIFICIVISGFSIWLIIRSDDLRKILIIVLSLTSGIYTLLGSSNLYHFLRQKRRDLIVRRIFAVNWVGCFLISFSTLVFLILGCKSIRGGLTFYTWVTFTLSNIFASRNPVTKLWQVMFSSSPTKDREFSLGSKRGSELQSTESIQKPLDLESQGACT